MYMYSAVHLPVLLVEDACLLTFLFSYLFAYLLLTYLFTYLLTYLITHLLDAYLLAYLLGLLTIRTYLLTSSLYLKRSDKQLTRGS